MQAFLFCLPIKWLKDKWNSSLYCCHHGRQNAKLQFKYTRCISNWYILIRSNIILFNNSGCLPDDDKPARILYSSGFRDIYTLMKFLRRVINNWFKFALHQCVYSTVYSVLSECLWKNFTGDSGGIRTHDLLLTTADVLTSRPPRFYIGF